jgi:hypothetical protein
MLGLFFPPVVAVIVGLALAVVGLTVVHIPVLVTFGVVSVAIGTFRYVRGRSGNAAQR